MDPNLLKKLGMIVCQAPVDDDNGGGGGPGDTDDGADTDDDADDTDDDSDDDSDDDTDDGDDTDDDSDDDTDDGDTDDDADDDGKDGDDAELGKRAQKRIGKLVKERNSANAEVKRLQKELENAQKLSGDDGKAILAAASRTGILPGLMTKDEAEAFTSMSRYPRVIENYQDWLDEHENGDEYGSGDNAMSYGQVKKRVRQLTAELEELKDEYGGRQKELRQKVRKIFELGMKAYRKGEGAGDEGKKGLKKKAKQKPSAHPHGKKPVAGKGGKKKNWGEVESTEDLVRMIASQNEGED